MKKAETTNVFNEGLVMDINPLVTPNNVVCNALNATLTTMNGNENALQNDMGNGRVETAFLPEGYIPLGTAELGGIIYIVSYNPLINKCQIGSFPSPERNITSDEVGDTRSIKIEEFYLNSTESIQDGILNSPYMKLILSNSELNPGDKYQISCKNLKEYDYISGYGQESKFNPDLIPRYLKLNVISISDSGKLTNLNESLVWQPIEKTNNYYYIRQEDLSSNGRTVDLDEYRNLLSSNYNVFNSKTSGKLGILAKLECIDSFEVSWDAICSSTTDDNSKEWNFYLYLNWSYNNQSSPDKINLYGVKCIAQVSDQEPQEELKVIENYPNKNKCANNDILNSQNKVVNDDWDNIYYTPYYVDSLEEPDYSNNGGITTPRKNDGSDYQFLLWDPIKVTYDTTQENQTVTLSITPTMPFGSLEWLKQSFSINLSKLGTGEIDLTEYRYYVEQSKITIGWGLDVYPEKNKSISQVTFNFYKINDQVYDWIKANEEYLDSDKIVTSEEQSVWDSDSKQVELLQSERNYYLDINKQSSYSGHFTEVINTENLNIGSTYLLEIKINYNNEKIVRYFRILYTQDIFNKYYYSVNDFESLVLQDVLTENDIINTVVSDYSQSNIVSNNTIYNDNEQVSQIPSYLREKIDTYNNYKIVNSYKSNIAFNLNCTSRYNLFSTEISNSKLIGDLSTVNSNTSEKQSITNENVQNSSITLDNIETESTWKNTLLNNNRFSGEFSQDISIPLSILYGGHQEAPIQLELKEISFDNIFILYHSREERNRLFVSRDIYSGMDDNISDDMDDIFPGHTVKAAPLSYYTTVYNLVKEILQRVDVLIILSRTIKESADTKITAWGKGTFKESDNSFWTYWREWRSDSDTGTNSTMLLYYAVLDSNGEPVLFTFRSKEPAVKWDDVLQSFELQDQINWTNDVPPAFQQNVIYENDILNSASKAPLKIYYKPSTTEETIDIYPWSIVNYYSSFSWNSRTSAQLSFNLSLKINNNVKLNSESKVNNLHYNNEINTILQFNVSDKAIVDSIISDITTTSTSKNFIKLPSGDIIEKSISSKLIYDSNGDVINYLKSFGSDVSQSNAVFGDNSKVSIGCVNEQLRIKSDLTPKSNQVAAHFRAEKQSLSITGIDLI